MDHGGEGDDLFEVVVKFCGFASTLLHVSCLHISYIMLRVTCMDFRSHTVAWDSIRADGGKLLPSYGTWKENIVPLGCPLPISDMASATLFHD